MAYQLSPGEGTKKILNSKNYFDKLICYIKNEIYGKYLKNESSLRKKIIEEKIDSSKNTYFEKFVRIL